MFYIAQHRHAGDDLWVIGQSESQFDKAVRDLVQDWHSLVNHRYRKFWFFKQPNVISVVISNESPKQRKSIAAAPKLIRFDPKGIGACFDTSAGMGQSGQGADIEAKTKGLPSWLLPLAVVGLGVLIIAWARGAGWLTGKLLTGGRKTPYAAAKSVRSPGLVESMMASVHPSSGATNSAEPVFLRGWARLGKDFVFFLSDDTTVRSSDTNVARFGEFWIGVCRPQDPLLPSRLPLLLSFLLCLRSRLCQILRLLSPFLVKWQARLLRVVRSASYRRGCALALTVLGILRRLS